MQISIIKLLGRFWFHFDWRQYPYHHGISSTSLPLFACQPIECSLGLLKQTLLFFFPSQNDVFHASNASLSPIVWGSRSDRSGQCRLGQRWARGSKWDGVALFAWPTPPGRPAANQRETDGCWVGERRPCCDGETWIMHRAEKLIISYLEICCHNSNP